MFCVGGCGPVGPVGPGAGRELRWGRWEAVWPTGCVMEELLEDMSIATGFTIEFGRGSGRVGRAGMGEGGKPTCETWAPGNAVREGPLGEEGIELTAGGGTGIGGVTPDPG